MSIKLSGYNSFWGYLLFLTAFIAPSKGHGIFNGLPLNGHIEAVTLAIILPLVFIIDFKYITSSLVKYLSVIVIVLKIALYSFAAPAGVCLQPFKEDKGNGGYTALKTYEGFWADGCFQTLPDLEDTLTLPMENFNRYYDLYDIRMSFRYYVYKSDPDNTADIYAGDGVVSVDGDGRNKDENGNSRKSKYDVYGNAGTYEFMGGHVDYTWAKPDWKFVSRLTGVNQSGKPSFYFPIYYIEKPGYGLWGIYLFGVLSCMADICIFIIIGFGLLTCLIKIYSTEKSVFSVITVLSLLYIGRQFILPIYGMADYNQVPPIKTALSLLPDILRDLFHFYSPLALVAMIPRLNKMGKGAVFIAFFSFVFYFYGPHILEGVGRFELLADGNDWRTFQRYSLIFYSDNLSSTGMNCPPTWNLPFAYFVMFLHLIGGQSLFFQKTLDVYSLAVIASALCVMGVKWGMAERLSWICASAYLFIHVVLGYYSYIGIGLIEHTATLVIFLLFLMFDHYRNSNQRSVVFLSCIICFIAIGWRPNFLPWFLFSIFGYFNYIEATSSRKFLETLWRLKSVIIGMLSVMLAFILLMMTRNYLECNQFVYIAKKVSNMYALEGIGSRLSSVWGMITSVDQNAKTSSVAGYIISCVLLIGWSTAFVSGIFRAGLLRRFPLPLFIAALGAFCVHFFFFKIYAGYNVRWAIPLLPLWVISFFFLINDFYLSLRSGRRRLRLHG